MSTNFKIAGGADIDTLFEPLGAFTKRSDVGFVAGGQDISNRYAPVSYGSQIASNTGFKVGSQDLKALFAGAGTTEAVITLSSRSGDSYDLAAAIDALGGSYGSYRLVIEVGVIQPRIYYESYPRKITIENHGTIVGYRGKKDTRNSILSDAGSAIIIIFSYSEAGYGVLVENYGAIYGGGGAGGAGVYNTQWTDYYPHPVGGYGAGWDIADHTNNAGATGTNGGTAAGGYGGTGDTDPGGAGGKYNGGLAASYAGGGGGGGGHGATGGAGGNAQDGGAEYFGEVGQVGAYAILDFSGRSSLSVSPAGVVTGGVSTGTSEQK